MFSLRGLVRLSFTLLLLTALWAGCSGPAADGSAPGPDELPATWPELEQQARGSRVTMMMWQGDPLINRYMQDWVVPELRNRYGVELRLVSGQGSQILQTLMAECEAGRRDSQLDLIWINGETFFQLRELAALYGPFTDRLPNNRYVDWDNPFIAVDFQQPVQGYECPWGNVQMALIYDSLRVPQPPQTLTGWENWWRANPGLFTLGNDFTGMTLLKSWLIQLAGGGNALNGPFDPQRYDSLSAQLWDFVNRNKSFFWNRGSTFPASVAQMHQLFAQGELAFTMSNNDAEVDNKIAEGFFPLSSRAYVPATGTIRNSHYLGIPAQSRQKAAALVAINFLISPEAQWQKAQPAVWGDGSVLSLDRLEPAWRERFASIPGRRYAPPREALAGLALMEPAPEYMIRLFADFRTHVLAR
jgi:putative spermidine/putrescine transport system substrate-binding protein